ncbi:PPK2 family polyphosphate kinase [Bifidobacterium cebidarum]|uniref:Polyphosphate kinase n=1 Tax=Bifidobacterium cebidarum TaxID=2650773 RepID=A0A6I1GKD7_9BIFI|nr:PPK2 family polyphosphate kinase [Bifidobacterium cebidarum]KAB7788388.1 polyphosphate kinase [Bifidobacterium cebidarum]
MIDKSTKHKDAAKHQREQSKRINRALDRAADCLSALGEAKAEVERRDMAERASDLLSSVWSLPPAQRLMFTESMNLTDVDPDSMPGFEGTKADGERFIEVSADDLARYQMLMYANGVRGSKRRLLIVLQGMDASGKGGIVRHVFSQGNPMGMHYKGFGKPTEDELRHDFLWRVDRELPQPGWISIFDRSHYEDVVMPHVYGTYPESVWRPRYERINEFEAKLADDGCSIIKIFLMSSKEEQRKHFLGRLEDPTKYWKFDISDLDARDRWDEYMNAWQEVFTLTSTEAAPWYLVPADNRWYSRAVVSELLRDAMRGMNQQWPELNVDPDAARQRLGE